MGQRRIPAVIGALALGALLAGGAAPQPDTPAARRETERLDKLTPVAPRGRAPIDHSGRAEKGRASYYAAHFAHRKMANGRRMDPNAHVAASKTLPLGTTARVVNTENGKQAVVQVEDRGPFVDGRVVDVSPRVAKELDIGPKGVVPVVDKPIAVPQPDGDVKLGAGAADATRGEVQRATEATRALAGVKEADNGTR